MSQVTGKKVAVTPMPTPTGTSGAIIDSFNTQDDQTVNAPSIHIVKDALTTINDNLAQTPITVGGETLSTIDDKLNFIIEGLPLTDLDDYEIYHYYATITGARTFTMTNKIVMVFCTGAYKVEDSCIGNKNGSLNYYPAYVTLNVTDDYNFTITTASGVEVKIIVLMEKSSS